MSRRGPRPPGPSAARRAAEFYLAGGGVTLNEAAARFEVSRTAMWKHVAALRAERGLPAAERSAADQQPGPTLAQTIDLLTIQAGRQLQPSARRSVVALGWARRIDAATGSRGGPQRRWRLTETGEAALASSPHVEAARREFAAGARMGVWP